jgi:hypothetical protein
MQGRGCIAVCSVALLALLACSTTGSRIRRHQDAFDHYPERVQQNLRNGVIEVGYTPEMVFIALGEPDRKVDVVTGEVAAQVWTWWKSRPGIGVSLGGYNSLGSSVGLGTGMTLGEDSRREETAVVEFRGDRVHRFERLAPH